MSTIITFNNLNSKIKKIACSDNHIIILNENNELYSNGVNTHGQLGLGDSFDRLYFSKIYIDHLLPTTTTTTTTFQITNIFVSNQYSLFLTSDGNVYVCGKNYNNRFASTIPNVPIQTTTSDYNILKFIKLDLSYLSNPKIVNIFCNNNTISLLGSDNTIYICGTNDSNLFGINNFKHSQTYINKFTILDLSYISNPTIKQISYGNEHSLLLTTNGDVYSCGLNFNGQLGLGDYINKYNYTKLILFDKDKNEPIDKIACGDNHSVFLSKSNKLYMCGDNRYGQLNLNNIFTTNTNNIIAVKDHVKDVFCAYRQTMIFDTNDNLYGTGNNKNQQLAKSNTYDIISMFTQIQTKLVDGTSLNIKSLVLAPNRSIILTNDDKLYYVGYNPLNTIMNTLDKTVNNWEPIILFYNFSAKFNLYDKYIIKIFFDEYIKNLSSSLLDGLLKLTFKN